MKFVVLAASLVTVFGTSTACAQEASSSLSFNAALTSDYRYRGISQTRLQPAVQGGADVGHPVSGLYAGAWASTIKWTGDAGGNGDVELDVYAGLRAQLPTGISYDIGVLAYIYPSNRLARVPGFANANTTELYGQLSHGPVLVKYSHALSNLFGFVDSKHSGYLDLAANLDAGEAMTVNLHVGRQHVANNRAASYTDWKVGLTRDFGIVSAALAYVGTDAGKTAYASPANGKFLGKSAMVLTISKTF